MRNITILFTSIMLSIGFNTKAQIFDIQTWEKAVKKKTCLSGDCQNGNGKIDISGNDFFIVVGNENQTTYEGTFKNGVPNGKGTLIYKDYFDKDSIPSDSIVVIGEFTGLECVGTMRHYQLNDWVSIRGDSDQKAKLIIQGYGNFFFHLALGKTRVTLFDFATITPTQKFWDHTKFDYRCIGKITYKNRGEFFGEIQNLGAIKGTYKTRQFTATLEEIDYNLNNRGSIEYSNGNQFVGQFKLPDYDYMKASVGVSYRLGGKTLQLINGKMNYADGRKYSGDFIPENGKPKNPENIIAAEKTADQKALELSIATKYAEAQSLIANGEIDKAFAIAQSLIDDNKQNQEANVIAAKIYSEAGENRKACITLRYARTLGAETASDIMKMMKDVCRR